MTSDPSAADAAAHAARRRIRRLAELLDSGIGIPGTRLRIGIEALIGLVPVAGDAVGLLLGAWFVYEGLRLRAPAPLLARMAANVAVDALAGTVPVIGDVVDFAFKSNQRNARLLEAHLDRVLAPPPPLRARWPQRAALALALALLAVGAVLLWRSLNAG